MISQPEGLEDISIGVNEREQSSSDDDELAHEDIDSNEIGNEVDDENDASVDGEFDEEYTTINCLVDVLNFDMLNITLDEVKRLDFVNREMGYLFYCWYAKLKGFGVRKSRVVRNKTGDILQETYVCSRAGLREDRGLSIERRRREVKNDTRCDCKAMFRVHVNINNGRWYVTLFSVYHNHEMLEVNECGLLPCHRKLKESDILQISNFNKVGIRPPHMYASFANNSGGYENIGFIIKDIYNQVGKQRKEQSSDVSGAMKFLQELCYKDPMMFVSYTIDDEMRLQHLFWCDGERRLNYEVFGDVLAFDATYKKNKYLCPLVVFSGINHHNQTIVFAAALVRNETEETYIWLLEQFLESMNGKAPCSVITDGDLAMRNAIRQVFPNAHHRLCAWHLLRNAISNVKIPGFLPYLKICMLGDLDVGEFEEKWSEMISKFGLENNSWIAELYERKNMWSTAYIRGNFFVGIRTTSRCEAFHSHIGKYVHCRINLMDFVQQFHRCLSYFRYREFEADFRYNYGEVVLTTSFHSLERSAAKILTKDLFLVFRPYLKKATHLRVVDSQHMTMFSVYTVEKYITGKIWHVSYCPSLMEFRCNCMRMESIGLPCDHVIVVLLYLNFSEIPKDLFFPRWTRCAKDPIRERIPSNSKYWDTQSIAKYATLVQISREVSDLACREEEDYSSFLQMLTGELKRLKVKHNVQYAESENEVEGQYEHLNNVIQDPPRIQTKGCGRMSNNEFGRSRRVQTCRNCGLRGHNKRSCTNAPRSQSLAAGQCLVVNEINTAPEILGDYSTYLFNEHSETFIASTSHTVPH